MAFTRICNAPSSRTESPVAPAAEPALSAATHAKPIVDRLRISANMVPLSSEAAKCGRTGYHLVSSVCGSGLLAHERNECRFVTGAKMKYSRDFKITSGLLVVALGVGGAGLSFPFLQMLLGLCATGAAGYFAWSIQPRLSSYARIALALIAGA